jgi:hypothetical protein
MNHSFPFKMHAFIVTTGSPPYTKKKHSTVTLQSACNYHPKEMKLPLFHQFHFLSPLFPPLSLRNNKTKIKPKQCGVLPYRTNRIRGAVLW